MHNRRDFENLCSAFDDDLVLLHVDIAGRRAAEQARIEDEERLRLALKGRGPGGVRVDVRSPLVVELKTRAAVLKELEGWR